MGFWKAVATLFTVVNLVGLGMAMAVREQMHSGIHVLLALLGAYAMWRLGASGRRVASPDEELSEPRLEALQQSVDAIALEVERISEAQRFQAKLQAEPKETAR
jgi:hypothetical protein